MAADDDVDAAEAPLAGKRRSAAANHEGFTATGPARNDHDWQKRPKAYKFVKNELFEWR